MIGNENEPVDVQTPFTVVQEDVQMVVKAPSGLVQENI